MDIGLQIKKFREQQKISQEELALKIFVSRQTISNWETNKSCPDVKSLITLSNIFNVSLDNFIKEDIKEMREIVEKATIKKFNVISVVFLIELIVVAISAYPLFSIKGNIGIIIWLCLFAITLYTASKIEKFKKSHDIQTYKEILAFIQNGEKTFEDAAKEFSSCPSSQRGGDLGQFGKGQMVKEFEDAAVDAEIGKVVGPVKTQFGYHLIKVEKKNEPKTAEFEEVKGQIYQQLLGKKQNDAYEAKVKELKDKYLK